MGSKSFRAWRLKIVPRDWICSFFSALKRRTQIMRHKKGFVTTLCLQYLLSDILIIWPITYLCIKIIKAFKPREKKKAEFWWTCWVFGHVKVDKQHQVFPHWAMGLADSKLIRNPSRRCFSPILFCSAALSELGLVGSWITGVDDSNPGLH